MGLTYKDILARLERNNVRSHFLFETLVLKLLGEYLRSDGKELQAGKPLDSRRNVEIDGIAPDGVDDLIGPTLVEIKLSGHRDAMRALDKLARLALKADCRSLLLILGARLRPSAKLRIVEQWAQLAPTTAIQIWDAAELSSLVEEHSALVESLVKELTTLRLRSVVEQPVTDWKQERDRYLEGLRTAYSEGNLTLVLGAGVSIDAGLPDWTRLLDSLFVRFLTRDLSTSDIRDSEIEAIVKRLKDVDDPSPLMTARYLRHGLAEDSSQEASAFQEAVTEVLYRKSRRSDRDASDLLKTLAHMTHPRRSGAKINAVVTYNFDDLLEKELDQTGDLYRSIFREGDVASLDELPVYHVHGFLPQNREQFDGLQESTLAFSEEGYHEIYSDSYHWSNLVQLSLLRDSTCLFVGLSLTDPNLRRLLEIAATRTTGRTHYALMKRMDEQSFMHKDGKKVVDSRVKSVQQFLDNHHRVKEELFRELGVSLVWFEDHKDLPRLLQRIES